MNLKSLLEYLAKAFSDSKTGSPSSKRLIALFASTALIASLELLSVMCAKWVYQHGDLGSGAVTALLGLAASVAGLAGVAYRKPETISKPNQKEGE